MPFKTGMELLWNAEWLIWWKADYAHAVHPNHRPDPGKGFGEGGIDGVAYCGKTIPARHTYPPSVMCDRCPRCRRELIDKGMKEYG